jgi:hypothetical protein
MSNWRPNWKATTVKLKEAMQAWCDLFPGISAARPAAPALVAAA